MLTMKSFLLYLVWKEKAIESINLANNQSNKRFSGFEFPLPTQMVKILRN